MISTFLKEKKNANDQEKLNWLRLIRTENLGPITFYKLLEKYGSVTAVLEALPELNKNVVSKRKLVPPSNRDIEKEFSSIIKFGAQLILITEASYPLALAQIEDAPPVITVKGNIDLLHRPSLSIVGSRNASLNSVKFTQHLSSQLGKADYVITSGLARGIDTAAHKGSFDTGTIAVVAGGIDVVYPKENQKLYEQICNQGLIIAESPLGTAPRARDFPRRNRIVSALSQGTIVIEAALRSGSLITARLGAEQGREIFAVPGHPLEPRAAGTNQLLRDGATLVRSAEDVLNEMNMFGEIHNQIPHKHKVIKVPTPAEPESEQYVPDKDAHSLIMQAISTTPTSIKDLSENCSIPTSKLQSILTELELQGQIQRLSGGLIIKII